MRLRYLCLPRCGPLVNLEIVFGQEPLLFGHRDERPDGRKGAINFVVGVNGTGKSSLLRGIFQTFRALKSGEFPSLPVTVAWDWSSGTDFITAVFHHPGPSPDDAFFSVTSGGDSPGGGGDCQGGF